MTRYAKAPTSGRNPHLGRTALFALLLLLGAMALTASSALALEARFPTGTSFGPDGSAGSVNFKALQAVTVDQASGDIYALDTGEGGRLYKFDSAGAPASFSSLAANFIEGVEGAENGAENEIAIAPPGSPGGTAGDIYVANNSVVKIYSPAGAFLGEITGDDEVGHEACGVATDPAGHVFVGFFPNTVREYTPSANPAVNTDQSGQSVASLPSICNVAADGLGNIYASNFSGASTAKLEGLTNPSPTLIEPGGKTLAVDPATNDLYLDRESSIAVYSATGVLKGQFGAAGLSNSHGVAIGSTAEKAYVNNGSTGKVDIYGPAVTLPDATTEPADAVTKDSATLHGTISVAGGPAASCEFQYITEAAFQANKAKGEGHDGFEAATSAECSPHGPFSGSGSEAVSAPLTSLTPGTDYRFRVVGANVNGSSPGQALGFLTLGPTVVSATVTNITTTAATLTGFVNPHGKPFTYHFDYGPTASYGSSVPVPDAAGGDLPIGVGNVIGGAVGKIEGVAMSQGAFAVGQDIAGAGIEPGTTITAIEGSTLRLSQSVAFGGSGVSLTSTTVFVSQPISGLAPGTEYHARLVATSADATTFGPDRGFSTFFPADPGLPDARAYEMVSPALKIGEVIPPEPMNALGGSCTDCLPGVSTIMMPMQARPDGGALAFLGQPFSSGLAAGVNEYLSQRAESGWHGQSITSPLLAANAEAGFKALSTDLTRGVLLQTAPALSPEAPIGEEGNTYKDLYLWEAGNPNLRPLVAVKPPHRDPLDPTQQVDNSNTLELAFAGGNSGSSAGVGAFEHLAFEANDALTGAVPGIAPAAPEAQAGRCGSPGSGCNLYEWVGGQLGLVNVLPGNETAATHAVIGSGRQLAEGPSSRPLFLESQAADVEHAISADGSRIFWSDGSGQVYVRIDGKETLKIKDSGRFLTAAVDGSKVLLSDGCLYSLASESCESLSGSSAGFLGIMGASEDLSRIYFVSTEALAPGAQPGTCVSGKSGLPEREEKEGKVPAGFGCNIYAFDEGEVFFIGTINEQDNNYGLENRYGSWRASSANRTAQVSPDGRYLAFISYARLTSYDNHVVGNSHVCRESSPFGPNCTEIYEYDLQSKSTSCPSCNPTGQRPLSKSNLGLIRPAASQSVGGVAFPQPGNLPADGEGRIFFESQDALTGKDINGRIQDVYEWTPNGVGDCSRAQGCVALISSGHSPNDSMFVDATPSGNDVFLITREQLLPRDKDDLLDVYDARVNGGIAEEINPPCGGEACKGVSSSPSAAESPGTSTFSGPPNKKPHKHKKHRKHKAKKHKSKKAHKRSAQHKKTGGLK